MCEAFRWGIAFVVMERNQWSIWILPIKVPLGSIPSLKLTASLPLKMDGWKMKSPFGMAYLEGLCKFREGISYAISGHSIFFRYVWLMFEWFTPTTWYMIWVGSDSWPTRGGIVSEPTSVRLLLYRIPKSTVLCDGKYLASLKLTVRTWKWMVGILVFFGGGPAYFQGLC